MYIKDISFFKNIKNNDFRIIFLYKKEPFLVKEKEIEIDFIKIDFFYNNESNDNINIGFSEPRFVNSIDFATFLIGEFLVKFINEEGLIDKENLIEKIKALNF